MLICSSVCFRPSQLSLPFIITVPIIPSISTSEERNHPSRNLGTVGEHGEHTSFAPLRFRPWQPQSLSAPLGPQRPLAFPSSHDPAAPPPGQAGARTTRQREPSHANWLLGCFPRENASETSCPSTHQASTIKQASGGHGTYTEACSGLALDAVCREAAVLRAPPRAFLDDPFGVGGGSRKDCWLPPSFLLLHPPPP